MALTDEGNGMVMPVTPMYGNGGNGFGFGGDWAWIILLLLAFGGWGNGFGGGFGGGFGNMMLGYDFPWLLNGQNGINSNVSGGFRDAQLHDSITSVRDGVSNLSTQLCNCCGDMQMSLANGVSALSQQMNANQLAALERSFAEQTANTAGLSALQSALASCCCENRLASADLKYTVATENCADRAALSDGIRDVLAATQAQTQTILDKLCQDKIDAKNDTINQLRAELLYARGQASQDVQTATLRAGQVAEVDALYNRLATCPVGTMPVYGNQPIFTCGCGGMNTGCGCGVA